MPKKAKKPKKDNFILNCVPSLGTETDWTFGDAVNSGAIFPKSKTPSSVDLREGWWKIRNQKSTGACVGFATADSVLRWHFVKAGKITKEQFTSPRFIWMANKETDDFTAYPSTFLEVTGTQTKLALRVARNYGCVLEEDLPKEGDLSFLHPATFYAKAAQLRISSYYNLTTDVKIWKAWLASQGPILTRLDVDRTWDRAASTGGHLKTYYPNTVRGGHAVAFVGYTKDYFIVRNSWDVTWGDKGFGYASNAYVKKAFTEAYGAVL